MGRHAGWIAAASGLAGTTPADPPHVIVFPESPFDERGFLTRVKQSVERYDYCVVVVSEGARDDDGNFLAESAARDAFGHAQLGGVAPVVASIIKKHLGYKYHYAIADYLQRSARHVASRVDVDQAYAVGRHAVDLAIAGETAVMPTIVRESDEPYQWSLGHVALSRVANREKKMPRGFISRDGFGITPTCRRYLQPLILGEDYPPYRDGLPDYVTLKNARVPRRLETDFVLT
jgi:6-phosphofructokinase 1